MLAQPVAVVGKLAGLRGNLDTHSMWSDGTVSADRPTYGKRAFLLGDQTPVVGFRRTLRRGC
jgi:hypothetical protein